MGEEGWLHCHHIDGTRPHVSPCPSAPMPRSTPTRLCSYTTAHNSAPPNTHALTYPHDAAVLARLYPREVEGAAVRLPQRQGQQLLGRLRGGRTTEGGRRARG